MYFDNDEDNFAYLDYNIDLIGIYEVIAEIYTESDKLAYDVLKMKGFSRSEFIFIGDEPYMLEMNTTPGLTEESILPQQAKAAGITLSELFENAINEALNSK